MKSDISVQAASRVRLREARFEDHPQITALESKFDLVPKSYEEWTHLWTANPAYSGLEGKIPIGWVLEDQEGKVSGYLGNIPVGCELEGKSLLATTTRAWVVEESARSYALLLLATYFRQPSVDLFLNTSVNSESARAYGSFDGIPVPVGEWDRSLFWVTHYPGFVQSFLHKKRGRFVTPLSYPLSAGVWLTDRLRRRGFPSDGKGIQIDTCAGFDERFDTFWEELRKKNYRQLLSVRSRDVMQWHFKYSLLNGEVWIYTWGDESKLLAYAIFDRQDYHPVGLKRMRLTDFQCLDDAKAPAILRAMLKVAMTRCCQEGVHMLELTGINPRMEQELELAAPHRRELSNWRYFYKANRRWLVEKLKSPEAWNPSFYDGDSSL
jgi:hypothetical protein